jgi:hypothetical protein
MLRHLMLAVGPKLLVPSAVQQGCEISAIYGPAVAQVSFRLSPTSWSSMLDHGIAKEGLTVDQGFLSVSV